VGGHFSELHGEEVAPARGEGRKLNHLGEGLPRWRPARPEREPHSCSRLSRQVALSKKWMGIFAGEWPRGAPSPGRPGLSNLPCEAKRCVAALRAGDYAAADIIGFVTESSGSSDPVTLDLTGARLAGALTEARPPGYWAHPPER